MSRNNLKVSGEMFDVKKLMWGLAILLLFIFVLLPFPASDLIIRIYFNEIEGDSCVLYYATDEQNYLSEEQCVPSVIDYTQNRVEFRLDSSLEGHLTSLRLDFPHLTEQLICVRSITISSAGVIQREYNPCVFFAEENIAFSHETDVTLVHPRNWAYLSIGPDDPYLMLSDILIRQIEDCYSHQTVSRFALCLFLVGVCVFARKKLFT